MVLVRVCFKCKQYLHIFPENASNQESFFCFNALHSKHPIQTIDIKELDSSYICISDKKREKIYIELLNNF